MQRRHEAEQHAGEHRYDRCQQHDASVHADLVEPWNAWRCQRHQGVNAPDREQQAERAAAQPEHHAFGQ
jgi:hypothetical protein